jgi:hypothetical protein
VYVIDFLIIRRCPGWLQEGSFTRPILLSLYVLCSINVGDINLDQYSLWPLFLRFVDYYSILPKEMAVNIKMEIARCFSEYKVIEALSEIPLTLNFEKLIKKKNEQFYIPKIECIS